jgi:hypothetical protein
MELWDVTAAALYTTGTRRKKRNQVGVDPALSGENHFAFL